MRRVNDVCGVGGEHVNGSESGELGASIRGLRLLGKAAFGEFADITGFLAGKISIGVLGAAIGASGNHGRCTRGGAENKVVAFFLRNKMCENAASEQAGKHQRTPRQPPPLSAAANICAT